MKQMFPINLFILFFLLTSFVVGAQNIEIDARKLKPDAVVSREADFSKGFVVKFIHNKENKTAQVKVADKENNFVAVKKGISTADTNSFNVEFIFKNRGLVVQKIDGDTIEVASINFVQINYGSKGSVQISNKAKPGKTDAAEVDANIITAGNGATLVSGIEVHDAIFARQLFVKQEYKNLFSFLGKIKNLSIENPTKGQLLDKAAYGQNPFIKKILDLVPNDSIAAIEGGGVSSGGLNGFISKVGNLDVTTIADGIARFLVKRTKEELSIAFFQHFKDLINDEKYLDARLLFPKTTETLNAIDDGIYQFDNYITTLRETFESDLSTLPDHLPDVINDGRYKSYFNDHPNVKYAGLTGLYLAKDLLDGSHPGKVLQDLPEEYKNGFSDSNVTASISALQLISASVRSKAIERYWTSFDSVKMLFSNDQGKLITADFYLGFLYEKAGNIKFKKGKTLQTYLDTVATKESDVTKIISYVSRVSEKCNTIEASLQKIKNKKPDEPTIDVYHRLFNSFADIIEQINYIGDLSFINNPIESQVKNYLEIARESSDFALNVGHKNYGSAIINTYNIYLTITKNKEGNASKPDSAENKIKLKTSDFIKKYGNFMANVVKAKNSEEVSAAIESVALPVGSASIKRHSEWNIALNAYVGVYLGGEKIKGIDTGFKANSYGITAPIGISISKGINWQKKGGWSTSLFISILDLGAPVAFRFKDDKTEAIPTIQLRDIVSPGIFASVGFPRFPVSCNIGWQAGPVLRKINEQLAEKASSHYSRWSISLVVDIPVLNFYTRRNE